MSTNEKKPRRTFDQDFIDGAVKLVTQEGYSLATYPSQFGPTNSADEAKDSIRHAQPLH